MNFINWIVTNWYVIVLVVAVIVYAFYEFRWFYKLPNSEKVKRIKACLLNWVTIAAKKYDDGEFDLLISEVYNDFCVRFPVMKSIIPVTIIKEWIKEAFDELEKVLKAENKTLAAFRNSEISNFNKVEVK